MEKYRFLPFTPPEEEICYFRRWQNLEMKPKPPVPPNNTREMLACEQTRLELSLNTPLDGNVVVSAQEEARHSIHLILGKLNKYEVASCMHGKKKWLYA